MDHIAGEQRIRQFLRLGADALLVGIGTVLRTTLN
jgi:hypothetical protein